MTGRRLAPALALLLAACSSDDGAPQPDSGPAGAFTPPECDVEFGRTLVFSKVVILPQGEGVDITGDDVPDNLLGRIAPLSNPTIVSVIGNGTGIFLLDFLDWDDAPADDEQTDITFYLGVDVQSPPDPSDNIGGTGDFFVADRQFDVDCNPLARVKGSIAGGVVRAEAGLWRFLIEGVGTLSFERVHLELTFEEDLQQFSGQFGTGWSVCSLARVVGPLFAGSSLLETIVNDLGETHPDLDFDDDGLEEIIGNGEGIAACIDGDGTVIEGPDCPCDPRIGDAYSVSVAVDLVPATISGIIYGQ
jgi:hypothetical protein